MGDSHPYRNSDVDSDREEEEQVVFDISGKLGGRANDAEKAIPKHEKTYYLSPNGENSDSPGCGFMGLQFPSLGRYATLNIFIVILTVLCCFQGMFYAFWISIITSIEKQYELSSTQTGFVTALGELGRIACFLGLSFYGELSHRPRWIAFSALAVTLSYIFMILPNIFAPDSSYKNIANSEICHLHRHTNHSDANVATKCSIFADNYGWRTAALTIFGLAHIVSGAASGIPVVYGISLIQDHFVRKDSALYLGIHFVAKVLGPVFGFLLGALCTAMLVGSTGRSFGFEDHDPRWLDVRAGHISLGVCIIALLNFGAALSMLMFPSEFVVLDTEAKPQIGVAHISLTKQPPGYRKPLSLQLLMPFVVFKEDVKKLLCNPIFLTRVAAVITNVLIISGFYVFLPKYLETQFYVQPNAANIATAIAIVLPTGCGIIVGCFIYRYCDFKPKHSTVITMVTSTLFFAGFLILIAFRCESRSMAGVRTSTGVIDIRQPCNFDCDCQDIIFSPVCDVNTGTNFFSPCRAGCSQPPPINASYPEPVVCGCATSTTLNIIPKKFCAVACNKLWPYVFVLFLMLFAVSVPTVGSVMLIYRTVPGDLMLTAQIVTAIGVGIFALFPSPMIFGGIMDSSCLLWSAQGCSGDYSADGACLLHDNVGLSSRFSGTVAGLKVLAILVEGYMLWKSRRLEFDEVEPAIMWSPDAVKLAFTETVGR